MNLCFFADLSFETGLERVLEPDFDFDADFLLLLSAFLNLKGEVFLDWLFLFTIVQITPINYITFLVSAYESLTLLHVQDAVK